MSITMTSGSRGAPQMEGLGRIRALGADVDVLVEGERHPHPLENVRVGVDEKRGGGPAPGGGGGGGGGRGRGGGGGGGWGTPPAPPRGPPQKKPRWGVGGHLRGRPPRGGNEGAAGAGGPRGRRGRGHASRAAGRPRPRRGAGRGRCAGARRRARWRRWPRARRAAGPARPAGPGCAPAATGTGRRRSGRAGSPSTAAPGRCCRRTAPPRPAARTPGVVEQRGDTRRAGRLDDELGALEAEQQRARATPRRPYGSHRRGRVRARTEPRRGSPTAMPSAIVAISASLTGCPAASEAG